jgi:hypothetical protein
MNSQDDLRQRYPMNRRTFVSMAAAGATSTLFQGTAAAAAPTKARNVVLVHGLFKIKAGMKYSGMSLGSIPGTSTYRWTA